MLGTPLTTEVSCINCGHTDAIVVRPHQLYPFWLDHRRLSKRMTHITQVIMLGSWFTFVISLVLLLILWAPSRWVAVPVAVFFRSDMLITLSQVCLRLLGLSAVLGILVLVAVVWYERQPMKPIEDRHHYRCRVCKFQWIVASNGKVVWRRKRYKGRR